MMRLKKHIFVKAIYTAVGVLFIVRLVAHPQSAPDASTAAAQPDTSHTERPDTSMAAVAAEKRPVVCGTAADSSVADSLCRLRDSLRAAEALAMKHHPHSAPRRHVDMSRKHPIMSVPSYATAFPDLQDTHYAAASLHGVQPVGDRAEAERRKAELVYVGASPFFRIDSAMHRSIPYLVPRASLLLHDIARAFLDSLAAKHIPPHTIIVTSVLRTEEDVARLRRVNANASEQSCHRFGTTFDISYYRFHTVAAAAGADDATAPTHKGLARRTVQNDTLKYVLSEVLRDMRTDGRCYVKHEVKQGCFHITTR